jgi:hypothetical protein
MSGLTKAYDDAVNAMEDKVEKAINVFCDKKYVIYSAYDYDEWDIPIDNLDEIPIKGKVEFIGSLSFESGVFDNPTWLDICVIANRMIIETKDYHHIYLEDVDVVDVNDKGYKIAKLIMGS